MNGGHFEILHPLFDLQLLLSEQLNFVLNAREAQQRLRTLRIINQIVKHFFLGLRLRKTRGKVTSWCNGLLSLVLRSPFLTLLYLYWNIFLS